MKLIEIHSLVVGDLVRFHAMPAHKTYKVLAINAETATDCLSFVLGRLGSSPTAPIKVPGWAMLESDWQRGSFRRRSTTLPQPLESIRL